MRTSSQAQVLWLVDFEDHVLALRPDQAGHIEWAHATHLFNSGYSPGDAAERYIAALTAAAK